MSVRFEEEQFTPQYGYNETPKGFVGLLMRWGLAKDPKGANIILLIIAVIFAFLAIFVFAFSGGEPKSSYGEIPSDQIIPDQFSGR